MRKTFFYCLLFVIFNSCMNDNTEERKDGYSQTPVSREDSIFREVMDGHDEAMAKMGKLKGYREEAAKRLDSVSKLPGKANTSLEKSLRELQETLAGAEQKMNTWMEEFSIDSAVDDTERRLSYLKSEKLKIDTVREKIFSALEKADSLLNK